MHEEQFIIRYFQYHRNHLLYSFLQVFQLSLSIDSYSTGISLLFSLLTSFVDQHHVQPVSFDVLMANVSPLLHDALG